MCTSYANDLGDSRSLVAVTDNVNQSKGDRDPAVWMPPYASASAVSIGTSWTHSPIAAYER